MPSYVRNSHFVIIVYDVTSKNYNIQIVKVIIILINGFNF